MIIFGYFLVFLGIFGYFEVLTGNSGTILYQFVSMFFRYHIDIVSIQYLKHIARPRRRGRTKGRVGGRDYRKENAFNLELLLANCKSLFAKNCNRHDSM